MNQTPEQAALQAERDRYAKAIRACYSTFKSARLYSPDHPTTKESAQKFVQTLQNIFQNRFDFSLKHVDGLFIVDDFFFIEESLMLYDLLRAVENRKLAQLLFLPGITPEEVVQMSTYLQDAKSDLASVPEFVSTHIKSTKHADANAVKKKLSAKDVFDISSQLYSEWLEIGEKTISKLLEEQNVALADLSVPLDRLIDQINQRPGDFTLLLCNRKAKNLHLQHSLNTMVQSIFLGQQMGFDLTSIKVLALGALFHDIGRWLLPSDFITGYKLDGTEIEMVQLHARDGASFLAGTQGLPMSVVRAALEHHMGIDGKGYPALPSSQGQHLFSQIIALADFVSWATVSERYYHKPVSPHRILRAMMRRSGTRFSPLLVKLLLPFFGLFPPGTLVELATGEKAVSMVPTFTHIARPLVLVQSGQRWAPRFLAEASAGSSVPFAGSIRRIIGRYEGAEALVPFLPAPNLPSA